MAHCGRGSVRYLPVEPGHGQLYPDQDLGYLMTHRIHGAGISTNIGGILMGSMLPYIAAPWIQWVMDYTTVLMFETLLQTQTGK